MKRILSFLLALLLALSLLACSAQQMQDALDAVDQVAQQITEPSLDTEPTREPTETAVPVTEPETTEPTQTVTEPEAPSEEPLDRNGSYTTREDVALFIHTYGCLPNNFITKKQAEALGWPGGSLEPYAPGKCIGGSRFGNYEGLLPELEGRIYTECDIDTLGAKSRGAKRIVFSNDGLIYYTEDHYGTFTLLYGTP